MALNDLVQAMRIDLGDAEGELFADTALERCVIRAIYPVGQDTGLAMKMVNGEIAPTPEGNIAEVLLLLAESYACGIMRGKTANGINISSGDKRVDRSTQAKHWADLEADLLARYRQRITEMAGGDFFITPPPLRPVMYEQGCEVIEYELCE
jgi:hypothetical protein